MLFRDITTEVQIKLHGYIFVFSMYWNGPRSHLGPEKVISYGARKTNGPKWDLEPFQDFKTCPLHYKEGFYQWYVLHYLYSRKDATPSIPEIIWVKNVRAILVCGFLMKSLKKHILKIWKKSWVPFGSYLLNSTANPAHFHSNWAELSVLFSR